MKLILDEKKIRKGKSIGLPYVGSKKKISKKIIEIIKQNFDIEGKVIYDVFGGGGAITSECIINGLPVVYNDLDKLVVDMFTRAISGNREWLKTLIISREEFMEIRNKENKTTDDNLKLLINSFGNNRKDYLYSKEYSDLKFNLVKDIIENHNCFSGYKQTETYKKANKPYFDGKLENSKTLQQLHKLQQLQQLQQLERLQKLQQLEQLQKLQQLERLQKLQQLERLEENKGIIVITIKEYKEFSNIKNSIFYLDPPYENATNAYINEDFDSKEFYDWAFEMSKNNIVIISSYEISDERFEVVYDFVKARSTISGGTKWTRTEKLFMAR